MSEQKEITITRVFNAPRALVWKAWTDPVHIAKWWGPRGFTNPRCEWSAHIGGSIYIDMTSPDGLVFPMDGVFYEVVRHERLVFISAALAKDGKRLFEVLNTIVFAEEGDQTRLTMTALVGRITPEAAPYLSGMDEGWNQSIDKLGEYLDAIK